MVRFHCHDHKQKGIEYSQGTEVNKIIEFILKHEKLFKKEEDSIEIKEDL